MKSSERLEELTRQGFRLHQGNHFGAVTDAGNESRQQFLNIDGKSYIGQVVVIFQDNGREIVYGPVQEYLVRRVGISDMLKSAKAHGIRDWYKVDIGSSYRRMAKMLRKEKINPDRTGFIMVDVRVIEKPDRISYQYLAPSLMYLDNPPIRKSA